MENNKFEELMQSIHERVFHMEDGEAEKVVDEFIKQYPELLTVHDRSWYIKYC